MRVSTFNECLSKSKTRVYIHNIYYRYSSILLYTNSEATFPPHCGTVHELLMTREKNIIVQTRQMCKHDRLNGVTDETSSIGVFASY